MTLFSTSARYRAACLALLPKLVLVGTVCFVRLITADHLGDALSSGSMDSLFAFYRFGKPMSEVARAVFPALAVPALGVAVVTYVPALSTWLPGLMK